MTDSRIRAAVPDDVPEILELIRALADYEREPDAVAATAAGLHRALFEGLDTPGKSPAVHCLVVDGAGRHRIDGIALWYLSFSTWEGRHGIYLEDLFVRPEARGGGHGRALLSELARICVERGYSRLEWWVLDWNTPAIDFYRSQGAVAMDEWTVNRVSGPALAELAAAR